MLTSHKHNASRNCIASSGCWRNHRPSLLAPIRGCRLTNSRTSGLNTFHFDFVSSCQCVNSNSSIATMTVSARDRLRPPAVELEGPNDSISMRPEPDQPGSWKSGGVSSRGIGQSAVDLTSAMLSWLSGLGGRLGSDRTTTLIRFECARLLCHRRAHSDRISDQMVQEMLF